MTLSKHLKERASQEKKVHVSFAHIDMCDGDIVAAILLSQIVYWFTPNKEGAHKITIRRDSGLWLAKKDSDWKNEIRLTVDQARRARSVLVKKGYIKCETHKFKGIPQVHIAIIENAYMEAWNFAVDSVSEPIELGPEPESNSGQNPSQVGPEPESLYSEITAENTTKTTGEPASPPLSLKSEPDTKNNVAIVKAKFLELAGKGGRWGAKQTKVAQSLLNDFSPEHVCENLKLLKEECIAKRGQYGWAFSMDKLTWKWEDLETIKEAEDAELLAEMKRLFPDYVPKSERRAI